MGNKNKTVSFRVDEDAFDTLREIAEQRDLSLSAVFRDYVDQLVTHDGQIAVVPEQELNEEQDDQGFPVRVEVPKSFIREHERLELEAEHLREQLEEHKAYISHLRDKIDKQDDDVVQLEELDEGSDPIDGVDDHTFKLG